jgi:hypothetical protein
MRPRRKFDKVSDRVSDKEVEAHTHPPAPGGTRNIELCNLNSENHPPSPLA